MRKKTKEKTIRTVALGLSAVVTASSPVMAFANELETEDIHEGESVLMPAPDFSYSKIEDTGEVVPDSMYTKTDDEKGPTPIDYDFTKPIAADPSLESYVSSEDEEVIYKNNEVNRSVRDVEYMLGGPSITEEDDYIDELMDTAHDSVRNIRSDINSKGEDSLFNANMQVVIANCEYAQIIDESHDGVNTLAGAVETERDTASEAERNNANYADTISDDLTMAEYAARATYDDASAAMGAQQSVSELADNAAANVESMRGEAQRAGEAASNAAYDYDALNVKLTEANEAYAKALMAESTAREVLNDFLVKNGFISEDGEFTYEGDMIECIEDQYQVNGALSGDALEAYNAAAMAYKEACKAVEEASANKEALEAELEALGLEENLISADEDAMGEVVINAQSNLNAANAEVNRIKGLISEYEEKLNAENEKVSDAEEALRVAEAELEAAKATSSAVDANAALKRAQEVYRQAKDAYDKAVEEANKLDTELANLEGQLEEAMAQEAAAQSEYEEAQANYNKAFEEAEEAYEAYEASKDQTRQEELIGLIEQQQNKINTILADDKPDANSYWKAADQLANYMIEFDLISKGGSDFSFSTWKTNDYENNNVVVTYKDANGQTVVAYFDYIAVGSSSDTPLKEADEIANADHIIVVQKQQTSLYTSGDDVISSYVDDKGQTQYRLNGKELEANQQISQGADGNLILSTTSTGERTVKVDGYRGGGYEFVDYIDDEWGNVILIKADGSKEFLSSTLYKDYSIIETYGRGGKTITIRTTYYGWDNFGRGYRNEDVKCTPAKLDSVTTTPETSQQTFTLDGTGFNGKGDAYYNQTAYNADAESYMAGVSAPRSELEEKAQAAANQAQQANETLASKKDALDAATNRVNSIQTQINDNRAKPRDIDGVELYYKEVVRDSNSVQAAYEKAIEELATKLNLNNADAVARVNATNVNMAAANLAAATGAYEGANQNLTAIKNNINTYNNTINQYNADLVSATNNAQDANAAFETAKEYLRAAQLTNQISEISSALAKLEGRRNAIEEANADLVEAINELDQLRAVSAVSDEELVAMMAVVEEAKNNLASAQASYESAQASLNKAIEDASALRTIANGVFRVALPNDEGKGGNTGSSSSSSSSVAAPVAQAPVAQAPVAQAPTVVEIDDEETPLNATIEEDQEIAVVTTSQTTSRANGQASAAETVEDTNAVDSSTRASVDADGIIVDVADVAVDHASDADSAKLDEDLEMINIDDEETPLGASITDEQEKASMNWWWLLIVATCGVTGYEMYRLHTKKREKREESNR